MLKANLITRLVFVVARHLERGTAILRGKGFGSFSIDHEVKACCQALGRKPLVALDVGGNIGEYTAAIKQHSPQCHVTVFEPSAGNVEILRRRFGSDPSIVVVPMAVSDQAGTATLYADQQGSGAASLAKRRLDHFGVEFAHEEAIRTTTLDQYWRETLGQRPVDILKMDIEGHELAALTGGTDMLDVTSVVQFEFGGCNIDTRTFFQDYFYFFTDKGFDLYRITPIGVDPVNSYREEAETFVTTNYLAVRRVQRTRLG